VQAVKDGLDRQNQLLHLQIERAGDMLANNRMLREENLVLTKQVTEQQEIVDTLKDSGGKTRNKLKTEVGLLTLEKTYLEGVLQETEWDSDEHYARLEFLALSMLETLAEARHAQ